MFKKEKLTRSLSDRFWKYVKINEVSECWEWIGKSKVQGYGVIGVGGRKDGKILAHRLSYIMWKGDIPDSEEYHGMVVMHECDNRLCVNPGHLSLGTQKDNVRDMDKKGRRITKSKQGSEHHATKINSEQAASIYLEEGVYRLIAEKYGCTLATVKNIKRRVTWKHATEHLL